MANQYSNASQWQGLSDTEAAERLRRFGLNEPEVTQRPRALVTLARLFLDPLTIVLLIASGITAVLGEYVDASLIVTIVLASTTVNFLQSYRSQQALERLRSRIVPTATVLRDGRWREIPRRELVPGDIVKITAGDLVPADARLLEAVHLMVQQAALTGESVPVEKQAAPTAPVVADPNAPHMVFLGSSVVSGAGIAEVVSTGQATLFGNIVSRLAAPPPETAFQRGLRQFSLLITRTVTFLVLFVLAVTLAFGRPPLDSILFAVALAVGLTPEFLPMIVTIALAQGALRMARRRVLVKSLPAIENLGSVDIVCSDKTGTLTLGSMQLTYALSADGTDSPRPLLLGWVNARTQSGLTSPFDQALLAVAPPGIPELSKLDELPFDFERRRVTVAVRLGEEVLAVTKGAPEAVLPICVSYEDTSGIHPLDEAARQQALALFRQLSAQGYRVLAVAWRAWSPEQSLDRTAECDFVFAGLLAFADPPLPEATETIRQLAEDGVRVKILTGDNELVAAAVCRAVGLPAQRIVLGSELEHLDPLALERIAEEADVFARVTPAQKHRIVLALKARGHAVAFLGDGINDAPSLHAADVGISVANAVDIAREAADIVLLDRRLSTLHEGILEGRRAFANVMTFLLMETSSNFGNVFSMAGAAVLLPFLPMLPHQILLNNFLYDLAQVAIPRDRVDPELTASPRRWDIGFIRRAMLVLGPVSSLFDFLTFGVLLFLFRATEVVFHTGWFVESLVTQCLVVFVIRTARAPWRWLPSRSFALNVLAVVVVGLLLPYSPLARLLGFVPLPPAYLIVLAGAVTTYLALVEVTKRWLYRRYQAPHQRETVR
ncbi:magnesium-translocating P-type ATPase [Thermomicrobium sp. 4228-Ro]|uniref:magnesium-translocating P-type ATPase n=1 Tax=Thermomicrobium sp. 4228-Ro TaxID=2993937 RepID=UPI002248A887|nr:magnesium-translocating P-type ATPase [Thermomicrobium sp. 4228-Ro]MCX2726668.1 magnesium-translocating P-type ATPase [Thermomicrobium sp. 4228-Ro]